MREKPVPSSQPETPTEERIEDVCCEHGTAMDVHCCNCHSGFIFDKDHECPEPDAPLKGTYNCPVCGWNVPHHEHAGEMIERLHYEVNAWKSWWQHVVLMLKSGIRPGCSVSQAKLNCDELIAGRGAKSPAPFISPEFDRRLFIPPVALPVVQDEAPKAKTCNWMLESDGEYYDTECGQAFVMLDGGTPAEHGMRFCAYCGKGLQVGPFTAAPLGASGPSPADPLKPNANFKQVKDWVK